MSKRLAPSRSAYTYSPFADLPIGRPPQTRQQRQPTQQRTLHVRNSQYVARRPSDPGSGGFPSDNEDHACESGFQSESDQTDHGRTEWRLKIRHGGSSFRTFNKLSSTARYLWTIAKRAMPVLRLLRSRYEWIIWLAVHVAVEVLSLHPTHLKFLTQVGI